MTDGLASLDAVPDGAVLLDEVHGAYTRYVIWPSPEAADAMTLFTAATHAQTAWEHASRLVLKSPIKRCGKTRAQEVARELVHNPLPTTNISPAALAHSINEANPPTLIRDEADTVWGKKEQRSEGAEDLRGILNSGHSRGWPYVRWDAAKRERGALPDVRHGDHRWHRRHARHHRRLEDQESQGVTPWLRRHQRDPPPVRLRSVAFTVLLVAGDKSGKWNRWYAEAIPHAEQLYEIYLKERAEEEEER